MNKSSNNHWENYNTLVFEKINYRSTFITSHPSEYLSIKGAEKLCVPSPGLVNLVIDIVKAVRPVVENFGDDEGTFPSRSKLVWLLLIHSENQVSLLEGSTLHVFGVEATQVLLINGRWIKAISLSSSRRSTASCRA